MYLHVQFLPFAANLLIRFGSPLIITEQLNRHDCPSKNILAATRGKNGL